jgi:hypothetical protein
MQKRPAGGTYLPVAVEYHDPEFPLMIVGGTIGAGVAFVVIPPEVPVA